MLTLTQLKTELGASKVTSFNDVFRTLTTLINSKVRRLQIEIEIENKIKWNRCMLPFFNPRKGCSIEARRSISNTINRNIEDIKELRLILAKYR